MSNSNQKIKTYNQYILALCGTIGLITLIFIFIFILKELTGSWTNNNNDFNDGIIATEVTEELNRDSLRKQIITFNSMTIIDSLNQIYILPVSHENLDKAEKQSKKFINNSYGDLSGYYNQIGYNNLVLYNGKTSSSEIIFDERISISEFKVLTIQNKKYIVIEGAKNDTNEDALLNNLDFQNIFIYDLSKRKLFTIDTERNFTAIRTFSPNKSDILVAQFGIDRNIDNSFDPETEPRIYYKVDVNTMTIQEIVDNNNIDRLQKQLEGR